MQELFEFFYVMNVERGGTRREGDHPKNSRKFSQDLRSFHGSPRIPLHGAISVHILEQKDLGVGPTIVCKKLSELE